MNIRLLTITCVFFSILTGCVTQTTGQMQMGSSDEEAAELNLQLGIGYLRQGDLLTARNKLERAIEQDPSLVIAHTARALGYERVGEIDAAE